MPYNKKVCVFGSSSQKTKSLFIDSAFNLGEIIATSNCICVNGGGIFGVMGALNRGCKSKNGVVLGIIHEMFCSGSQDKDMIICKGIVIFFFTHIYLIFLI